MFKLCLIQTLKGGLSDRDVISQAKTNMEYRYFLDLSIDDELPHFTKLGTFRQRLGVAAFEELFYSFVNNLKTNNIITEDELRFMDATHQIADVSSISINVLLSQACKKLLKEINEYSKTKCDIDLDKKDFQMTEDEKKKRFVELVELANFLKENASKLLQDIKSDSLKEAYDDICRIIKERSSVKDGKILRNNSDDTGKLASLSDRDATWGAKSKDYTFLGYKHNVTTTESGFIEVISTHQGHISDEHMLKKDSEKISGKKIVADSKYGTLENRKYCKKINKILVAPTRTNMKQHLKEQIMDDAFLYNKTEQYKEEMKKRGSNVEGKFGHAKTKLGFRRAKYRGIEKVTVQGLITAFVINLKSVVRWFDSVSYV